MGRPSADIVQDAHVRATRRWPKLNVSHQDAAAHIAAVLDRSDHESLSDSTREDTALEEMVLCAGLLQGDPGALAAFEAEFMSRVPSGLRRYTTTDQIDDLMQELRAHLLVAKANRPARISQYTGRGALAGWIRVVAIRFAINSSQRVRQTAERQQLLWAKSVAAVDDGDPELDALRRRYAGVLSDAYHEAARRLAPEQRALLYLSIGQRVGIDKLAQIYDVHRSTVARRITAAKTRLSQLAREEATERIQAGEVTLRSIERLIHSQVELSIYAFAQ